VLRCFLGKEAILGRRVKYRVVILRPLGPKKYIIAFDSRLMRNTQSIRTNTQKHAMYP
jgi:hypothetical protein